MEINTALILCAGYGKRLNPITLNKPKPLIEINKTVIYNFLSSLGILFIIKLFLTKKIKKINLKEVIFPISFLLGNLIIWIVGAAHPRFVYGLSDGRGDFLRNLNTLQDKKIKKISKYFKIN